MSQFKKIDYGKLLYETLRNYFAVNAAGQVSILYRLLFACVAPMQQPFDAYDGQRRISALVAACKWQIGQLTNLLNYLFDPELKRISITQNRFSSTTAPTFPYPTDEFAPIFNGATRVHGRVFGDQASRSLVTFNVPAGVDQSPLIATIEQVRIQGIPYQINTI